MAKKLRDEINHMTMSDTPEEYVVNGERRQLSPFNADGFRANMGELMGKGNYAMYSLRDVADAISMMGMLQQYVSFESKRMVLEYKDVPFSKIDAKSAWLDFPNVIGGGTSAFVESVRIKNPESAYLTACNNGVFYGDISNIPPIKTVDIEVILSDSCPYSMVGLPTIDESDGDKANAFLEWVSESIPATSDQRINEAVFRINNKLRFTPYVNSIAIDYSSNVPFTIYASSDAVTINGTNGTARQNIEVGGGVIVSVVGQMNNEYLTVVAGDNVYQYSMVYASDPLSWTMTDQWLDSAEHSGSFVVRGDRAWHISYSTASISVSIERATPSINRNEWKVNWRIKPFVSTSGIHQISYITLYEDGSETYVAKASIHQQAPNIEVTKAAVHFADKYIKITTEHQTKYRSYQVAGITFHVDDTVNYRIKGIALPYYLMNMTEYSPYDDYLMIAHGGDNPTLIKTLLIDEEHTEEVTEYDYDSQSYFTYLKFRDEYKQDTVISTKTAGDYKIVTQFFTTISLIEASYGNTSPMIVLEAYDISQSLSLTKVVPLEITHTKNEVEWNVRLRGEDNPENPGANWYTVIE